MPDLLGTVIIAPITPTSTEDQYPTHIDSYQQGGMRVVQTLAERDAIPNERRKDGMLVFVVSEDTNYRLFGGLNNSNWRDEGSGSQAASYEPVSAFEWTLKVQVNDNDPTDLTVEAKYEPQVIFNSDGDIVMAKVQY